MLGTPWIRSYPPGLDWNKKFEPKPIFALMDAAAEKFPNNPAIDFEGGVLTYAETNKLIGYAAKAFAELGVKKNSKVAIFLPNCPHFIISYFGVLKAGGTVVNCSPLYSQEEVDALAKDSDTEIIITLNFNLLYPKAENILNKSIRENGKIKKLIVCNLPEILPFPKNILFPFVKRKDIAEVNYNENIISWADLLKLGKNSAAPVENIKIDVNDTAIIQYTGGTTGVPKGAELTHANVYINAMQSRYYGELITHGEGVMLIVLPLFHVFAMTAGMLFGIAGAEKLVLHPRFDIRKVLKDIEKKKITTLPGVPTIYNAINNFKDVENYNLRSVKICVSGGGPLPVEVKRRFEERTCCVLVEGYGLTECSPVVSCNPLSGLNKAGSIGMPFPQTEILIEDMENPGKYLDIGQKGELCIKGPQVMKGYYKRPDATRECLHEGILKTGDVAMVDEDGYIFIVDRLKEMIISGGFKIYPRHVEEVIYKHPAVLEAAVIGVDDDSHGQKVKLFVVCKKNVPCSKSEIEEYCRKNLARHEMPKIIEIRDSLPKSAVGKILKKELK